MITGGIGEGKTSRFLALYQEHKEGAVGFYSRKEYKDGEIIGYSLVNLVTGESRAHCRRVSSELNSDHILSQGKWAFDAKAFEWASQVITDARSIWLDEVGALEMRGEGFAPIINYAIEHDIDLYIAIRERYADRIFAPSQYKSISFHFIRI